MREYNAYEKIGRLFPRNTKKNIRELMRYADIPVTSEAWLGFILIFDALLFTAVFLVTAVFYKNLLLSSGAAVGAAVLFTILPNLLVSMKADRRAEFVEKILPDILLLIVANIRSGMPPEKALLLSARKDFGVLSDEIKNSMKHAIAGENFVEALKLISKNIKSRVLERIVDLLAEGVRSGGEIGTLLEESANNIRQNQLMKKEIRSSVLMYIIFIFAAIGFAAPILYGISGYLVQVMTSLLSKINIPKSVLQSSFIKLSSPSITPQFAMYFALGNLMISSFFGSLIIGMIENGSTKKGLKYFPILLMISWGLYITIRTALTSAIRI